MNIVFPKEAYEEIRKAGAKSPALQEKDIYREKVVDSRMIEESDFSLIVQVVKDHKFDQFIEGKRIIRKIANIEKLNAGGAKKMKIKRLDMLSEAIFTVLKKLPRKWIWTSDKVDGMPALPYFVSSVKMPETRGVSEPTVQMTLVSWSRGKKESEDISFRKSDLGKTVEEILMGRDIMIETDDLTKDHAEDVKKYRSICDRTGEQYLATGMAVQADESYWRSGVMHMEIEGRPAKIVLDDREKYGGDDGEASVFHATGFWTSGGSDDEDAEESVKDYEIPVHPVVRAFDLWRHEFVEIHVANINEYVYDPGIVNKIVLPKEHTRLVESLTLGTAQRFEDVVKGKAAGVIILCTGKPGTGKTLTSEVYSEVAKRPLYIVQCSQLGVDPEALEKNLSTVLERATRWRAILLIDEADVYIHERGADINQNAIVGVFLRLLEYYNGILFMNTNREEVIDDAIMSRATAHVVYENPTVKAATDIWRILAEKFSVKLNDEMLAFCIKEWAGVSGRTIRQILRLARMVADREKKETTLDHLKFAASFQDLKGN